MRYLSLLWNRLAPLVLCGFVLILPGRVHAQTTDHTTPAISSEPATGTVAADEPGSAHSSRELPIMLALSAQDLTPPFFEHEPFGFDETTLQTLVDELSHSSALAWSAVERTFSTPSTVWSATWKPIALFLLLCLALVVDIFIRRRFDAVRRRVTPPRASPIRLAVQDSALQMTGAVAAPLAGWLLSFLVQGVFNQVPWSQALSDSLLLVVVFRLGRTFIHELVAGIYFPLPRDVGRRIERVVVRTLRAALVLLIALRALSSIDYAPDILALLEFCIKATFTVLSLQVFALQRPILALMPTEGSSRYLALRNFFARYLPFLLLGSVLLLVLWTAGFERAATTILSRLYGIVALVVAMIALQRLLDNFVRGTARPSQPLFLALLHSIDGFARLCIYGLFGAAILGMLGLWNPLLSLLDAIGVQVGSRPITLLGVLRGGLFIAASVLVSRVIRTVLDVVVYPRVEMEVGAGYAINIAVHWFIMVLALGISLIVMGVDLGALAVFSGALGIGLGLGLQDVARNLISGFVLLFGGSVQKGDLISVGNVDGYVEKMGSRAVIIRTRDNYELLVPTKDLINSTITNWTLTDHEARLHVPVGVSYGSDVDLVRNTLIDAGRLYPRTLPHKPVEVWFTGLADNAIHFELLFWVDVSVATPDQARGEIMFVVWESLRRAAIDVPFPQRDLRLREIDPQVLAQLRTLLAAGAVAADLAPTQPAAAAPVDPSATPSSAGTTPVEPSAEPAAD